MRMAKANLRLVVTALLGVLAASGTTHAQDYPAREIRSIVSVPPGTGMDIMIRYYSTKLSELAGKPVIVENKPGAQGNIATEYVVRAKPDGYTIMLTPASATLAAAVSFFKKLPFDPVNDLKPVVSLSSLGFVICVSGNSSSKSIAELTTALKAKPGNGTFGTVSNTGIIAAELYKTRAGLETNQVLYRGFPDSLNDLVNGQIDFITTDPTGAAGPIQSGRLRALAVTSVTRLASLPDIPTMIEAGFADFDLTPWIGLVVPASTPDPIVSKLAAWHRQINETEETKKVLLQFGMNPLNEDAAAMAARLKSDIPKWAGFAKLARIEPQ
ncbi:MAG TPA: tripartite tricarboxylate transporter substrate binding protein [Xanthobacteraceae bacterium]|nr:tripartite tricarboxylate transporter substrate binding protein [Xanthobacteraceae bacterium]